MPDHTPLTIAEVSATAAAIERAVGTVIDGKAPAVRLVVTVLLAEGHLLIEDVPGVGKTVLAKALAASVGGTVSRIQFTSDLLPSDVTGVSVFNQADRRFEFHPGPVFANLVIGDEINRASPKTQSALLEAMAERQVTTDGVSRRLDPPFTVIATQNPVDMEGTFPLPEAQRDRFMARLSLGYPSEDAEVAMLSARSDTDPIDRVAPVVGIDDVRLMIRAVRGVFVAESLQRYAVRVVAATRSHPDLSLGASPRAALHLVSAAKATAAIAGRDYVIPEDIASLAVPVLAHRLVLRRRGIAGTRSGDGGAADVIAAIVGSVPVPREQPVG